MRRAHHEDETGRTREGKQVCVVPLGRGIPMRLPRDGHS